MDDFWLWHFRFGHLHFRGLKLLQQKRMVEGLPPIQGPDNTCESCILAKKHRDNFPKGVSYRAKTQLEIVHIELCGPMQTKSLGGTTTF